MAEGSKPKWEGKAFVELPGIGAEQAWPLLEDFCNLHKLIPIDTCYRVDGVPGQPGLIRYCASAIKGEGDAETSIKWAKEKLLTIDPVQRSLAYEIVDNNMGFKSYVGTMKVLPINEDATNNERRCMIEWEFDSDPVEGWTFQDLNSYVQSSLQFMAKKMEIEATR